MCTGYLEVHVAEEVLKALNIGKKDEIFIRIAGYQSAGDTCYLLLNRNTGIHQSHAGSTGARHGSRSVGFHGLGYAADCIRELFHGRKHRKQSPLCKSTMTDFTASRSSGNLGFTDRICREIVLMHVSLLDYVRIQSLYALCIRQRSQCADINDLCLASGEHRGSVHSRNQTNLCKQRTDLIQLTAVRTLVILQNHLANGLLLILVYRIAKLGKISLVVRESLFQSLGDLCNRLLTDLLVVGKYGCLHLFRRNNLLHVLKHLLRNRYGNVLLLRLANLLLNVGVERNQLLVDRICLIDVADHFFLRDLIGAGLNHDHLLSRRSYGETKIAFIPILLAGVHNHLTVHKAKLRGCAGTCKRNIRNGGSKRCTHHGNQLRTAIRIHAHNHALQGNIIAHILREQRTHRTIDDAARQNCIVAGLSFSLLEAARNLSDCVKFLTVLYGQREEIHAVTRCCRLRCRAQNGGIAVVHERAAVCLLANSSDIHGKRAPCKLHGICGVTFLLLYLVLCHFFSLFLPEGPSSSDKQGDAGPAIARPVRRLPISQMKLLSDAELLNQGTILLKVRLLEVIQQASSLTNHLQKTSVGMIILRVLLHVLGELGNSCSKNRDLNLR